MIYCASCAKDEKLPPTVQRRAAKCECCGEHRYCYVKEVSGEPSKLARQQKFVTPGLIASKIRDQKLEIAKHNQVIHVILVEYLGKKLPEYYHVEGFHDCSESPVGLCIYDVQHDPQSESCIFCKLPYLRDIITQSPFGSVLQKLPPTFNGKEVNFKLPPKKTNK